MDLDSALVLPLEVVPLPIAWQGEMCGHVDSRVTPLIFDAGEAFLPGYLSGETVVLFSLHPVRDLNRAKGAARQGALRNC
jgi:hypothetical protein